MRSDTRLLRKLLGSVLIAGWSVAYLALFFGLHYQLDGSGSFPRPVFYNKEAHFAELERSRASSGLWLRSRLRLRRRPRSRRKP
jgi:hypothetical protein